jgi:hypothetical protein
VATVTRVAVVVARGSAEAFGGRERDRLGVRGGVGGGRAGGAPFPASAA